MIFAIVFESESGSVKIVDSDGIQEIRDRLFSESDIQQAIGWMENL